MSLKTLPTKGSKEGISFAPTDVPASYDDLTDPTYFQDRYNDKPRNDRLTAEERESVIIRIATFEPVKEILAWLKGKGKKISESQISRYLHSPLWTPVVEKYRSQWRQSLMEVPLANKRKRLEAYESLYGEARKTKKIALAGNLLEHIRREMEGGESGDHYTYNVVQFNSLTDEDLERKRLQIIRDLTQTRKLEKLRGAIDASRERETKAAHDDGVTFAGKSV